MSDQYQHGLSRLTFWNLLYQAALASESCLWAILILPITEQHFSDVEPGFLVIPIAGLWFLILHQSCATFSTMTAKYGKVMPLPYLTGHSLLLLAALLLWLIKPWYGLALCLLALIAAASFRHWLISHQPLWVGESGRFHRPFGWVKRFYRFLTKPGDPTLRWMGVDLPFIEGTRNFCLMGAISSGKSITLEFFMASFIPLIGKRKDLRCLLFDPMQSMVSTVLGMNPDCPHHILAPRDVRSSYWEIDADIHDIDDARALAVALTPAKPPQPGPNDFWIDAAQRILQGIILYYATVVKTSWDFRDILVACNSIERVQAILKSHPDTEEYLYALNGERLSHSILVTVQTYLSQFSSIASSWHYKRKIAREYSLPFKKFSFANWVHEDTVTILSGDVKNQTAMTALNRLFITTAGLTLLNQHGNHLSREPRTFLVLDEVHRLEFLPEWEAFATNASSRGVSIAIALQALPSLQRIYGHQGAEAILGQFFHKGFLRLNDETTAEYGSRLIGRGTRFIPDCNSKRGQSANRMESNVPMVPPEDLRRIEPPAKGEPGWLNWLMGRGGTPLRGFYIGNYASWCKISPRFISKNLTQRAKVPNFVPWDIPPLPGWDYDDIKRLKLEHVISTNDFLHHRENESTPLPDQPVNLKEIYESFKDFLNTAHNADVAEDSLDDA